MDILKNYKLILASSSPRRAELLQNAGLSYEVRINEVNELYPSDLNPKEIPAFLAKLKAGPFEGKIAENEILLTADTIVLHNNQVLGKPKDLIEAKKVLSTLSDDVHLVVTAVCLYHQNKYHLIEDVAKVSMYPLLQEEIDWYLNAYNPIDKAGSYGIQDWIGFAKIKSIEGSYSTIMGLPVARVYEEIRKLVS